MTLFDKYKRATQIIVGVMTTIFVYIMTIVYPSLIGQDGTTGSLVLFILTFSTAYSIFYIACMSLYEKAAWKYIHRRDNYSGCWDMVVTYEFLERSSPNPTDMLDLPYSFHSVFKIEQTATSLRFPQGYSAANEVWKDRSSRMIADGIDMSYEIVRSDKKIDDPLPPNTIGFEAIRVTEYDKIGRPSLMIGSMYHAAVPYVNLYRGHTLYRRISSKEYNKIIRKFDIQEHGRHAVEPVSETIEESE